MRPHLVLTAMMLCACHEPTAAPPLRVMTWNIKGAQLASVERIAAQIREVEPDVVALQELFFDAEWNGHVDVAAELARLTGMHGANLVTLEHQGPFGFEIAGQMVLTREPVELEPLALASGRVVGAKFVFREKGFVVTHLPTEPADRTEGLAVLENQSWELLLGDLNTDDVSRFTATKAGCGPTFPAATPTRQIDWVLTRGEDAGTCVTIATTASDHLPMIMSFGDHELPAPVNGLDGALFVINTPDFPADPVTTLAAFVDRATVDEPGLPRPVVGLAGSFNETTACNTIARGVYTPCIRQPSGDVHFTTDSGALDATLMQNDRVSLTSVGTLDGGATFTRFDLLPTRTAPQQTTPIPVHPANRRVDVQLNGGTSLSVAVFRQLWDGSSYGTATRTFSNAPVTAKDMFDELSLPRSIVSVPGTMFDQPGLYFIVSTPLNAGTVTGFGDRSGARSGTGQVSTLWVE